MSTFNLIYSDFKKFKKYGANAVVILFLTQAFWAIFQYRIANAVYRKITLQPFRFIFFIVIYIWQKITEISTGISIPAAATIGHSFYIAHFGGVIINAKTVIGNNCNLSQGVTIGVSGLYDKRGVPVLGDNVYVGANTVIAGKINIGNNVLIGASSLVTSSVENFGVVVGVPAILISSNGSKGYI